MDKRLLLPRIASLGSLLSNPLWTVTETALHRGYLPERYGGMDVGGDIRIRKRRTIAYCEPQAPQEQAEGEKNEVPPPAATQGRQ